ncbi:MAG: glycolate oxidase subunit GlcE [Chromatiales bacterium]|nr:glycolate oxidase subunit GlcE [Chromatiales bacterium]
MNTASNVSDRDCTDALVETVRAANAAGTALNIQGSGTKSFLGREVKGQRFYVGEHRGITSFEPTELVLSARAGTPLEEIRTILSEAGQMLPFEPPSFGTDDTLGGALACGVSGPRRPYGGSARDLVLGLRIVNGRGELLRFGGEVIKNVAGYDVSRLMIGAQGTLGVILEASIKVLPQLELETTRVLHIAPDKVIPHMDRLGDAPHPISGMAYIDRQLYIRLSGTRAGVAAASHDVGGEELSDDGAWWQSLANHSAPFFEGDAPLWRIALPAGTPPLSLNGQWFLDWAGTQRWFKSHAAGTTIRAAATEHGGHAVCYRGPAAERGESPPPALMAVHQRLKLAFDPKRILNPGRLHPDL